MVESAEPDRALIGEPDPFASLATWEHYLGMLEAGPQNIVGLPELLARARRYVAGRRARGGFLRTPAQHRARAEQLEATRPDVARSLRQVARMIERRLSIQSEFKSHGVGDSEEA